MSSTDNTILAGFRGVPFFVSTETEEGGRKVAVHEYPGSDERFVQDLGGDPGVFRIRGYVADFHGVGWRQIDRRLTTALKDESEGLLDMSIFGLVRVKATSYSKTVDQTQLGRINYEMTFLVSTPNPSPVFAPSSSETVAVKARAVLDAAESDVANGLEVPTVATTAQVSDYDGTQLTTTVTDKVNSLGAGIDIVTSYANNIRDNISDFVRDPIAYASAMFNDGLLGAVFDTVESSRDTINAFSELCRVGYNLAVDFESIKEDSLSNLEQSFNIPKFADDANYRLTNNNNRFAITNSIRMSLFANYLKLAADADYTSDSDINNVIEDINDIYENVITIEGVSPSTALTLDNCRIDALNILDTKLQTTPNIVTMDLKTCTVDIELAYRLYAEDLSDSTALEDSAKVLTDLNDVLPNRLIGEVKVLKI